jgi:8-oxo-dGTP pyrophosphatase MutT (NUDIX family)
VGAAGGVWRRAEDGAVEVAFVHRPAYDDWELPKGKLSAGETEPDAALREVQEETGLHCRLGRQVGISSVAPTDARLADRAQGAAAIYASPESPSTTATPGPVTIGSVSP